VRKPKKGETYSYIMEDLTVCITVWGTEDPLYYGGLAGLGPTDETRQN